MSYQDRIIDIFIHEDHYKAVKRGNLEELIILHNRTGTVGNRDILITAINKGNLSIVEYLCFNGVNIDEDILKIACKVSNTDMVRCLLRYSKITHMISSAIEYGNASLVEYFHTNGELIPKNAITSLINGTSTSKKMIKTLEYLSVYIEPTIDDFILAVKHNRYKVVKWLHEHNYPTIFISSRDTRIEKYLHDIYAANCKDNCIYCQIAIIKVVRESLYSTGYGDWLYNDIIEEIILGLYNNN